MQTTTTRRLVQGPSIRGDKIFKTDIKIHSSGVQKELRMFHKTRNLILEAKLHGHRMSAQLISIRLRNGRL